MLYGIGAWTLNETLTYAKENTDRIHSIEKTSIENTMKIEQLNSTVDEVIKSPGLMGPSEKSR